ncbi:acyl-CoA dehydrogenase family protein [Streptomyces sp. NPDC000594]|uniref:acyl-CoA dehydrogenase family protein n=1 Tax=Streptomyces sp. NPDC000594 TaxID=3154261 RepID=UPI00332FCB4E
METDGTTGGWADDRVFRAEARAWLRERTRGAPAGGGDGRDGAGHEAHRAHRAHGAHGARDLPARRAWERELGAAGWIGIGWPEGGHGNRTATLAQQVIWAEEYSAAGAPDRLGHIGENLLAPTLIAHGTPAQKRRFLGPVARGEELWCQGYSEPGAGSDLAAVRTAAVRDGDRYRITGQKIWTSLAREADWCFVLARTEPGSTRHRGLSFLLVPMDQPGRVEVRPIRQLTGDSEFNEVFFDGAEADAGHRVGAAGDGWRVATDLLARERGVSTLVQQIGFAGELDGIIRTAVTTGAADDPVLRALLVRAWAELRAMRWNALRTLGTEGDPGAPSVAKLLWGGWHRRLGELAVAVRGASAATGPYDWSAPRPYELDAAQRLFLFSRADTVYGGSDEIQRDIIAERVLGLPREPR